MLQVGDVVIVKSQKTKFFEVIKVEEKYVWVSNGWVQIKREFNDVELLCTSKDRKDKKIPLIPFVNC